MSNYLTREQLRKRRRDQLDRHLASFPTPTLREVTEHLFGLSYWPCGHVRSALNTRHVGEGKTTCARCRAVIDQRYRDNRRKTGGK